MIRCIVLCCKNLFKVFSRSNFNKAVNTKHVVPCYYGTPIEFFIFFSLKYSTIRAQPFGQCLWLQNIEYYMLRVMCLDQRVRK